MFILIIKYPKITFYMRYYINALYLIYTFNSEFEYFTYHKLLVHPPGNYA